MPMLHGWPQHWYEWRHLVPTPSRRYWDIRPDLRGLGWTDALLPGTRRRTWPATCSRCSMRFGSSA